jgi:type I restriction enzyme, S subunit
MSTITQKQISETGDVKEDNDLPEGWEIPSVGEILTVNYGKGLKEANRKPGKVSVYGSNGTVGKHVTPLTGGPTIIIGRKGTVGAVHFSPEPCWPIDTTYYIDEFQGLDPEYVTFALCNLSLGALDTSTAIPGLNRDDLYKQDIPLAPYAEQKRIVAKVEELFTQVNTTRVRLAKVSQILKRFRQAVLAAACTGRLTEEWRKNNPTVRFNPEIEEGGSVDDFDIPESWNWSLSSHEFEMVTSGSRGWAKYYADDDGPIFIRVGNLDHDSIQIDLNSVQHVRPPARAEGLRTRVRVGDILISITADVGMIALINDDIGEAYINQHVALARPSGRIDRRYLAYFLSAPNGGQRQFQILQRGATKVGLGLDDIRNVCIACPPIDEQHEIVRRIEALFELANSIEKRVEAATKRADRLTQAILAKAFRGELVPTEAELARREGREYEPASELLKRICLEREAGSPNEETRRRADSPEKISAKQQISRQ